MLLQRLDSQDGDRRTGLDVYARSVVEHTTKGVEQDVAWLDGLIAARR